MKQGIAHKPGPKKSLRLAAAGVAALAVPLFFGLAKAQSQAVFDVASIKLNTTVNTPGWTRFEPAGVNIQRAGLLSVIATAYRIPAALISWDERADGRMREVLAARYDIVAKAEHEVPRDQLLSMLQALMADRFRLALHRESKTQPVYKLVVAKSGPKLKLSQGTQARDPGCAPPKCMVFRDTNMWDFAAALGSRMGRPVVDLTELNGTYDFTLRLDILEGLSADDPELKNTIGNSDWSSSSIFTDLERQLGLRLVSDKAPVEGLVIDHVERPSAN